MLAVSPDTVPHARVPVPNFQSEKGVNPSVRCPMPLLSIQVNFSFCLRLGEEKAGAGVTGDSGLEGAAFPFQDHLPSFLQMWGVRSGRQRVAVLLGSLPGPSGSPLAHAWCLSFPFCQTVCCRRSGREWVFLPQKVGVRASRQPQGGPCVRSLFRKSLEKLRKEVGSDLRVLPTEA